MRKQWKRPQNHRFSSLSPISSRRIMLLIALFVVLYAASSSNVSVSASKLPEASSTLLKLHRQYTQQPPHDVSLYNILQVSPNATLHEIKRSYRKISRKLHPDKQNKRPMDSATTFSTREERDEEEEERQQRWTQVQQAYGILSNDQTRLPYHKYGLMDNSMAAFVLTGGSSGAATITSMSPEQKRLLQWMGYTPTLTRLNGNQHQERVLFLAARLVELIRPLVEGAITEAALADAIAQECDALKKCPLGAQILRCIGRAYRHAGQAYLRHCHRQQQQTSNTFNVPFRALKPLRLGAHVLEDKVRETMRDAKHLLTAAVASGRLVWTEQVQQQQQKKKQTNLPQVEYHMEEDAFPELLSEDNVDDYLSSHLNSQEEIQQAECRKAQTVLLEALQVEALWKISKIDLDRTTQEACRLILSGHYFFFPLHQQPSSHPSFGNSQDHGWVGSTGQVVDAKVGRWRAARALVMIGNVMVQCSKKGTSWKE